MYGGSTKLRRGSVRKLSSIPPPSPPLPLHRPSTIPKSSSKLRNSNSNSNQLSSDPSATSSCEKLSLVPGDKALELGSIIKLTPDLIEEIRRVESEVGLVRVKFDNSNPRGANVIDVDGKEFTFTWSTEFDGLCDIYEERQNDEDGNGLLVESGCAWRKLTVKRVLDESISNLVKMRSEEANRKNKSRKAIVLDHRNPSMKSQLKQITAVETKPKNSKQKKDPTLKKRKVDLPLVTALPKSSYKSGAPSPSVGVGSDDVQPICAKSIEIAASSKKEIPARDTNKIQEKPDQNRNFGSNPMDMQSLLISLPKGMSKKKGVSDTITNSVKKIDSNTKNVADFKAPGRRSLKPGGDFENSKKTSSERSSPGSKRHSTPAPEVSLDHTLALKSKSHAVESDRQPQQSKDLFGDGGTGASSNSKEGSDEKVDDTCYFKYEKNKPELKGPIKDVKEYREYEKEYLEKYEIYSSLLKDIKNYRNKFEKMVTELEFVKGTDKYNETLDKINKEGYGPNVVRHKRLKKILIVVHQEMTQIKKMAVDFAASFNKD
ncbi:hypothetical protein ACFE04_008433 [Oxalis oulophora]